MLDLCQLPAGDEEGRFPEQANRGEAKCNQVTPPALANRDTPSSPEVTVAPSRLRATTKVIVINSYGPAAGPALALTVQYSQCSDFYHATGFSHQLLAWAGRLCGNLILAAGNNG
jgi:hypothetical protein